MNKTGNANSSNWKRIFTEKVLPPLIIAGGTELFRVCANYVTNYVKHKRKLKEISHATNEKIRQQTTKKKNINSSENIPIEDSSESSMISVTVRHLRLRRSPTMNIPASIRLSDAPNGSARTAPIPLEKTVAATPMLDPAPNHVASSVPVAIHSGRRRPATRKSPRPLTLRPA